MRMNEKVSSYISYAWGGLCSLLGGISPDWWMVVIGVAGWITTSVINNYWQKKRFNAEFGNEQD